MCRQCQVYAGVPQGSIMGPLSFILYINDLPGVVKRCQINVYADDIAIYISHKKPEIVTEAINSDVESIYLWFCANKVSMYFGKTVTMLICNPQKMLHLPSQDLNVQIQNRPLSQVSSVKYRISVSRSILIEIGLKLGSFRCTHSFYQCIPFFLCAV